MLDSLEPHLSLLANMAVTQITGCGQGTLVTLLYLEYTLIVRESPLIIPDNIPLVPKHHLPISLDGVKDNDFTMVLGYPGSTDRYLSSYGVKLAINLYNPTVVKVREAKLNILNEYMKSDRNINIMYSSKKAEYQITGNIILARQGVKKT